MWQYAEYIMATIQSSQDPSNISKYWLEGEAMAPVRERLQRTADREWPVLICGPLGSARARIASDLHQLSGRHGKLSRFSCTADNEQSDRELFGYQDRPGLIEAAEHGTLYLDDIAKLPIRSQGRLLNLIEDRKIYRVESAVHIPVKLRVVAGTCYDLIKACQQGDFLDELRLALEAVQLDIPPLSQRSPRELQNLTEKLLTRESKQHHDNRRRFQLSRGAMKLILAHSWPGNLLELENTLSRAVALYGADSDVIEASMLELSNTEMTAVATTRPAQDSGREQLPTSVAAHSVSEELSLEEYFQRFVLEHQSTMNETKLAHRLGISRKCLWERRRRFGIPRHTSQARTQLDSPAVTSDTVDSGVIDTTAKMHAIAAPLPD